jgi:hypothetical protein
VQTAARGLERVIFMWRNIMTRLTGLRGPVAAALLALAAPPLHAADIDPEADRILHAMSDHLAGLQSLAVETEVADDVIVRSGEKIQRLGAGEGVFDRTRGFHFSRAGIGGDTEVVFDGKTLTVYSGEANVYASVPVEGGNDAALDQARVDFGIEAAGGADLLYANPYEGLNYEAISARYLGEALVGGVSAHHLAYRAAEIDWQIWVRAEGDPLPLRYVITSKWITGAPQFAVAIRRMDPAAAIPAGAFIFTPPADAKQISPDRFEVPQTLTAE